MTGFIPVVGRGWRARSVDDLALFHVSAHNVVTYDYENGVYRTKATAMVFIKSLNTEIVCAPPSHVFNGEPWHISTPYPPNMGGILSYIWWKEFPLLTDLNTIRKVVAREALDYLYKRWKGDGYPIIAVRLGLLDWSTKQGIPAKQLNDNKYSDFGLFKQHITSQSALHNGVLSGTVNPQAQQDKQYRYSNDQRFDMSTITNDGLVRLFRDYHISLESLVRDAWDHTYLYLRKWTADSPEEFQQATRILGQFVVDPSLYLTITALVRDNLKNDHSWRDRFLMGDNPEKMISVLVYMLLNNHLDSELQKIA